MESLFPCYIFVRCRLHDCLNEIRYTTGISTIVHFADKIPNIPETVIQELMATFSSDEPIPVEERLEAGSEVVLGEGAFMGMNASVLRVMPAGRRVQVLLDILGTADRGGSGSPVCCLAAKFIGGDRAVFGVGTAGGNLDFFRGHKMAGNFKASAQDRGGQVGFAENSVKRTSAEPA